MKFNQSNFCPRCGANTFVAKSNKELMCDSCGYRYFHNVAAATAALIICDGELLLANRAFEPAKGLFDFPGGFVDPDESLESGLLRELKEELSWRPAVQQINYFFSSFNTYEFAKVTYKTVDAFFIIRLDAKPEFAVLDDVAYVKWFTIDDIDMESLAFAPVKEAVRKLQATV